MSDLPANSAGGGLAPNAAAALAYVLGPFTGVLFLLIEKENRFVRFHAAQSVAVSIALIAVGIALSVLSAVLAVIPVLGLIVGLLLSFGLAVGGFVLWLVLMYRAYQGREWEVPLVGPQARRLVSGPVPQ